MLRALNRGRSPRFVSGANIAEEKFPEKPYSDAAVLEAIRLKSSNCYGALSFANALGGSRSDAWDLCYTVPLKGLID